MADQYLQQLTEKTTAAATDDLPITDSGTGQLKKITVANLLTAASSFFDFIAATELTISSGAITITQSNHTVDTESDAATDDLDTINGTGSDRLLFLRPANSARDVTLKHGTGNIVTHTGLDYTIPDNAVVALLYDGTNWRVLWAGAVQLSDLSDVVITTGAQGDMIYKNASDYVNLPPGTSGYFLKTQGAGANLVWASIAEVIAFNDLTDVVISGGAQGDVFYNDGSNIVNLGPGTSGYFLQTQGAGANPNWASISGSNSLVSLTDTTLTSVNDNDLLAYDVSTSEWINQTAAEAGLAAASHNHNASDINAGTLKHERGGLEADVSAYGGLMLISGGATSELKANLAASSAPGTANDSAAGYAVGSMWIDTTNDEVHFAVDVTPAVAVWNQIPTNLADLSDVVETGITDNEVLAWDSTSSKWINQTAAEAGLSASGGGLPVDDTTSIVQDPADNTKLMRIDVGAVAAGTTRILTMPDKNFSLAQPIFDDGSAAGPTVTFTTGSGGLYSIGGTNGVGISDGSGAIIEATNAGVKIFGKFVFDRNSQTLVAGVITANQTLLKVATEGGAASDDLDTINGGVEGQSVYLRANDSTKTVVVKDGTGNIVLAGGLAFSLDHADDMIQLMHDGTNWLEVSRSDNSP